MKSQTRLVLPDVHFPFQDGWVLGSWMGHLRQLKPDGVDIMGDLMDCYRLSKFDKNPIRRHSFQDEREVTQGFLQAVREEAGADCDIRYSEGNHEDRLRKMLWGKAPELADVKGMSVPELLGLADIGIKWHSTQNPYQIRGLWYSHGDLLRQHAGMSARAKADQIHGSVLVGHTHRQGWVPRTTWSSVEHAIEVGHVSDYRQLDYVRSVPNWQQGWAVVEFPACGGFFVNFVHVHTTGRKRVLIYKGTEL